MTKPTGRPRLVNGVRPGTPEHLQYLQDRVDKLTEKIQTQAELAKSLYNVDGKETQIDDLHRQIKVDQTQRRNYCRQLTKYNLPIPTFKPVRRQGGYQGKRDKRRSLAFKLKTRNTWNKKFKREDWQSDALDIYLEGYSMVEISTMVGVDASTVGIAVAREALYRLMMQKQAEHYETLTPDLKETTTKDY